MNRRSLLVAGLLAALGPACSAPTGPAMPTERGPHGGFLRVLPDALGFAEFVVEPDKGATSQNRTTHLAIFFLKSDHATSLSPAPTSAALDVSFSDSSPSRTFDLTSDPSSGDPAGSARFVSGPGDYEGSISGILTATIEGRAISMGF